VGLAFAINLVFLCFTDVDGRLSVATPCRLGESLPFDLSFMIDPRMNLQET
jgi:hypothetical protein